MSSLNKQTRVVGRGELTLALNAAEGRLQLVLGRKSAPAGRHFPALSDSLRFSEPEILAAQDWQAAAQGAELLAPVLEQALANLKLEPGHIGRVAVVNGPGSFTGLRLVCVTASALARGLQAGQAALEFLCLLAAGAAEALSARAGDRFWVLSHARRGLVYARGFEFSCSHAEEAKAAEQAVPAELAEIARPAGACRAKESCEFYEAWEAEGASISPARMRAVSDLMVLSVEAAASFLTEQAKGRPEVKNYVLGSGLSKNIDGLRPLLKASGVIPLSPTLDRPTPAMLLRAALELEYGQADIAPLYVRPSDAEENLPQIAGKLGFDGNYALNRLEELLKN